MGTFDKGKLFPPATNEANIEANTSQQVNFLDLHLVPVYSGETCLPVVE